MSDRVKPSRMLVRLEADIAVARTPVEADCRRAERVAYLARLGRFDEGRSELDALHQRYDRHPRVEVSAWCNFAEGLLIYFSNVGTNTSDRVQRAHALSTAAGLQSLRAVCAAWLAQWDYGRVDMDALAVHLAEALHLAGPGDHAARSRASLVAAQALHLGGRFDLAQAWYRRAKDHATADGDDATISALMHNMAWLRMMTMRQAVLTGQDETSGGRHALMNAESTAHFDAMVGDSSWQELKPILRAQIVSLQGDCAQAASLYSEHFAGSNTATRLHGNLLADKAWCQAQLGQLESASESAELAVDGLKQDTHFDDRASAHSRLAQVFRLLELPDKQKSHQQQADEAWRLHESVQAKVIALLSGMDEQGQIGP